MKNFILLLALITITLKLAQIGLVATWSWWLVLAPLWVPAFVIATAAFVVAIIQEGKDK